MAGQLGSGWHDAEFLLPGEYPFPVGIPAVVELARITVRPLPRHMMRSVRGAGAAMQVERLARGDLPSIGDELDRLVRQVLGQGIALLRAARRRGVVIVIEPPEPAPERPAVERAGRRLELRRQ